MGTQLKFLNGLNNLLLYKKIINISGESSTGKTTLALYLVGNLINKSKQFLNSCIWVQASESFPKNRLKQIFSNEPEKLHYFNENVFIIPKGKPVGNYNGLCEIFQTLFNPSSDLPPLLKFIVFDNISHHLRFKIAQKNNFSYASSVLDNFYEIQLLPLILFCQRNNIILVLIHEVSFDPNLMKNRPFFNRLYDRISSMDIVLSNIHNSQNKKMKLCVKNQVYTFTYALENNGINFY